MDFFQKAGDTIQKVLIGLIVVGVSWLVMETVNHRSELKLINYKLDVNNKVLQDLYEVKESK